MANRVGRPRTNIDTGELCAGFARLPLDEREVALRVMTTLHEVLPEPLPPPRRVFAPPPDEAAPETASSEVTQR